MKYIVWFELFAAAVAAGIGAVCLFVPGLSAEVVFFTAALLLTLSAAALWISFFKTKKKGKDLAAAVLVSLLAVVFWMHRSDGAQFSCLLFAIYMWVCFFMEAVQFILDVRDHAKGGWIHAVSALVYLVVGVLAWKYRAVDVHFIIRLFGVYSLYQALQMLAELFWFSKSHSSRSYSFRHWTALPVYIVGVLPSIILRWMMSARMKEAREHYDEHKNNSPVNLRVFIHTGLDGDHIYGHMTFAYKGLMYSYGNYDKAEEHFFRSVGPGVFFTVPADIYVNNSCLIEGSTIFEFGLHLNEEQEYRLQKEIDQIFKETYRWYCPLEKRGGRQDFKKLESDYSSRLSYRTGAKFRKFYHGPWKTYWILGDNCSLFADDVLSKIGCHIVHKSGIVSPGEYFEFFMEAYQDPNSNVVYRSWHDPRFPDTLFPTLA